MVEEQGPPGSDRDLTVRRGPKDLEIADTHALTVLFSPDSTLIGRVCKLPQRRLELGRQPTPPCLCFDDPLASRVHASVTWDPGNERFILRDESSIDGTILNGQEVERELLGSGDILRIGDTLLRFSHLDLEVVGWSPPGDCLLQGRSIGLRRVLDQVHLAARSDIPVLLSGEIGTGREILAREMHRLSDRAGPFRALNCAAEPEKLLESGLPAHERHAADGQGSREGTLFLAEVEELPLSLQSRLLLLLDEAQGPASGYEALERAPLRVVAATDQDLEKRARSGSFRPDLYARIGQWRIDVPPLRERIEDLLPIIERAIERHRQGKVYQLSGDFVEGLLLYDWPFNVQQLVSLVRRVTATLPEGGRLELSHLPREMRPAGRRKIDVPHATRCAPLPLRNRVPRGEELATLLRHYRGNVSDIAEHTGRGRNTVYRWCRRYGLKPDAFRDRDQHQI